jgi:hypothetical protein
MIKKLMLALVATGACSLALAQQPPPPPMHDDHPDAGRPMPMDSHGPDAGHPMPMEHHAPPPPPHHRHKVWVPTEHDSHGHAIKGHYVYR